LDGGWGNLLLHLLLLSCELRGTSLLGGLESLETSLGELGLAL